MQLPLQTTSLSDQGHAARTARDTGAACALPCWRRICHVTLSNFWGLCLSSSMSHALKSTWKIALQKFRKTFCQLNVFDRACTCVHKSFSIYCLVSLIYTHLLSESIVPLIQGCHAQGRRRDFSAAWRRGHRGGRHQCLPHLTTKHKLTPSACCKDSCGKTPTHRF